MSKTRQRLVDERVPAGYDLRGSVRIEVWFYTINGHRRFEIRTFTGAGAFKKVEVNNIRDAVAAADDASTALSDDLLRGTGREPLWR